MRRITAFLLSVILVFSLTTTAFAATVSTSADKTAVKAGEDVVVTLTQEGDLEGVIAIMYYVYFDSSLFTLKSTEMGTASDPGKQGTDTKGTYQVINYLDTTSEGVTIPAGTIATLTFTALEDVTEEQTSTFELVNMGVMDTDGSMITENEVTSGKVTITVSPAVAATYTVTLTEGTGYTIAAANDSTSPVEEGGSYSFTVTVNEGYEGTPVVKANDETLTAVDGVYTIENITADQTVTVEGITAVAVKTYTVTLTEGTGYTIAVKDSTSPVTEGGSYSFTITVNNGYEGTPEVKANDNELTAVDGVYTIENIDADQIVTVSGISIKSGTYTVAASNDVTTTVNGSAAVSVNVTGNSDDSITSYNDYDVTITYDTDNLTYVSANAADDSAVVTEENGTIRITGHGEAKAYDKAVVTLNFTALASGSHNVTITSAKIDNSGHAISANAPEAAQADDWNTVIKVAYDVELPDGFEGEDSVLPGEDYTFTLPDGLDPDGVTVTVGDKTVTPQVDEDGNYIVPDVDGDIVVKAEYSVTASAGENANVDLNGATKAEYGTNFTFSAGAEDGYTASVTITIGGEEYKDFTTDGNGNYTIPGADIKGEIVITVTAEEQAENTTQITFSGVSADEVVGGLTQTATNGQDFTFELNEVAGYTYTVTVGGTTLTPNENGVYTIPGSMIDGTPLTVIITKSLIVEGELVVEVTEYITLDQKVMWLVTATKDDAVLAYGEEGTMYWSDKYDAYCWLVVSDGTADDVKNAAEAAIVATTETAAIVATTETAAKVAYDYDVNQTGAVDINDAQLTYDMYTAKYDSFDNVTMDKFLEADLNGDKKVYTEDAAAIVNQIHPTSESQS